MMASFVEKATLVVDDKSSAKIKKINAELQKLNKTAMAISRSSSKAINIKVNSRDVVTARNRISSLQKSMKNASSTPLNVKINGVEGVVNASNRIVAASARARAAWQTPLVPRVNGGAVNNTVSAATRMEGAFNKVHGAARKIANIIGSRGWQNFQRGFSYAFSGEVYNAGRRVVGTAASAPITMDTARTKLGVAGFDETMRNALEEAARDLSKKFPALSAAEILESSIEAAGGVSSSGGAMEIILGNMEKTARNAAILTASASLSAEESVKYAKELSKVSDIQGFGADPVEAKRIEDAALRAIIASGGTMDVTQIRNAMQQSGLSKYAYSDKGLLTAMLLRDEGGRMFTGELRQFTNDSTRVNLSDKKKEQQIELGLRDKSGAPVYGKEAFEDPFKYANDKLVPILKKLGVDITDVAAVGIALETKMGYNAGAARGGAVLIAQKANIERQLGFAGGIDLDYALRNPSIAMQAQQVTAQFSNVAEQALGTLMPVVSTGLDAMTKSFANIARGGGGAGDYATIAASAVPAALGIALQGLGDPVTRPLSAAGLALTSSAIALDTSAAALTAAAATQAATNAVPDGGKNGKSGKGWKAAAIGMAGRFAGIASLLTLSGSTANNTYTNMTEQQRKAERLKSAELAKAYNEANPDKQFIPWLKRVLLGAAADPNFSLKNHIKETQFDGGLKFQSIIDDGLKLNSDDATVKISDSFTDGSTLLSNGISESLTAGSEIIKSGIVGSGSAVAAEIIAALLQAAPQLGVSIGNSMSAGFNPAPLSVDTGSGADLGANNNNAR